MMSTAGDIAIAIMNSQQLQMHSLALQNNGSIDRQIWMKESLMDHYHTAGLFAVEDKG